MFNVSHAVAVSPRIKKAMAEHPDFRKAATFGNYDIFEVLTCDRRHVVPLASQPVLYTGSEWRPHVYRWFRDAGPGTPVLVNAASVPEEAQSRFPVTAEGPADLPRIPIPGAADCQVSESILDEEVRFETTCPGIPHLVRVTYHPKWRVQGADRIDWASPAFMVVTPKERQVRLFYGPTGVDRAGTALSILGLFVLVVGGIVEGKRRARSGEGASEGADGIDEAAETVPPYRKVVLAVVMTALAAGIGLFIYLSETSDPNALYQKGILAKDAKAYEKARSYFGAIVEGSPGGSQADEASYYYAICFYLEKKWDPAIEAFERLVAGYPDSVFTPEGLYHIGLCLRSQEKVAEAKTTFGQVVARYPLTQWAGYARERLAELGGVGQQYGHAIALFNEDRCDEASPIFERIVEEHPDYKGADQALACYALCFHKKGDREGTIRAYRRLLEGYPQSRLVDEAHYHIGQSQKLLGRIEEAKSSLERVVREFPESRYAGQASTVLAEPVFAGESGGTP